MYQLRNVINRTSVPLDPQKNMNAAEDFMLLLLQTHIIAAAESVQALSPTECLVDLANAVVENCVGACPM